MLILLVCRHFEYHGCSRMAGAVLWVCSNGMVLCLYWLMLPCCVGFYPRICLGEDKEKTVSRSLSWIWKPEERNGWIYGKSKSEYSRSQWSWKAVIIEGGWKSKLEDEELMKWGFWKWKNYRWWQDPDAAPESTTDMALGVVAVSLFYTLGRVMRERQGLLSFGMFAAVYLGHWSRKALISPEALVDTYLLISWDFSWD